MGGGAAVLLVLSVLKLLCEVALLCLLGQALLFVLAGNKRHENFFYQLLQVPTKPLVLGMRRITPAKVADHHVPFVVFFLLSIAWAVLVVEKYRYCKGVQMVGCPT